MTLGSIDEGKMFLRAKIDMASSNMNLRDPALYRIKKAEHHRTGAKWVVYPMYDYAHPLGDWMEGITHSVCTLEFEVHRPLYDWVLESLELPNRPQQIEFARLNLTNTVMSKRLLLELVQQKLVMGWDDPRMPTISGLRRRGYTPSSIRTIAERIGISKADSVVDINLLYFCIRDEMNATAPRRMGVLDPLKVVITNWPDGKVDMIEADNNPEDPSMGKRLVPFGKELWIERDDFMEVPVKKYFRLAPGAEVRLKHAYYITCKDVIKDALGNVSEIHCEYDPESRGGGAPDGRKVKGTLHWVSAEHAVDAEVRLFDHLFTFENLSDVPENTDYKDFYNPKSMVSVQAKLEPSVKDLKAFDRIQFLRHGYFCVDCKDSKDDAMVFNRTVELKDGWAKEQKKV
jgi:glutaminyl-tRNA synthetase